MEAPETRELKERVIEINRVAKVVKGGRRFSFTALVVSATRRQGRLGYGKAREVPLAIPKAVDDAKKNLFSVPKHGTTIHTRSSVGSMPPASCCGRRARAPVSSPAAASAPCLSWQASVTCSRRACGTTNPINMAKATVNGLKSLRRPEEVARSRGKTIMEVLPWRPPVETAGDAVADDAAAAEPEPAEAETSQESPQASAAEEAAE